jgi:DsbC/DsbD-like thiol-disulfide interchange protein
VTESNPEPSGPGTVLLDIGGDVGALIIITPAAMAGEEIHVSPVHDPAGRTHAVVRERRRPGPASSYAAVYPALPAGEYTIWRNPGQPAGTVRIDGGAAATYRWPGPG